MITTILLLSSIVFATIYPLFFWLNYKTPIQNGFFRFNIGIVCVVAAFACLILWSRYPDKLLLLAAIFWLTALLSACAIFWKNESVNPWLIMLPCLSGMGLTHRFLILTNHSGNLNLSVSLLGGLVSCAAIFAMILGHWYLNIHGLPLKHLKDATKVLLVFLAVRVLWDIRQIVFGSVNYLGDPTAVYSFLGKVDGFLVLIALFFGTILPLTTTYFVFGTLKLKNTQAATGLLYVIVASILMGDLAYKYYFLKFGLAL